MKQKIMSKGINKVILIGNLGCAPEIRYTPAGHAVANIRLATTSVWKDKNGISQEKTEWHQIVLFNRRAEISGQYLKKGSKVYIEGSLRSRKWQDSDGIDRYTTEILANNVHFLEPKIKENMVSANDENLLEDDVMEQSDEEFFKV